MINDIIPLSLIDPFDPIDIPRKAQVIRCLCGSVIAACIVPECYLTKVWQKDIRKYVKRGYSIDLVESDGVKTMFGKCTCPKDGANINQVELTL